MYVEKNPSLLKQVSRWKNFCKIWRAKYLAQSASSFFGRPKFCRVSTHSVYNVWTGWLLITLVTENSNVQPVEPPHSNHNPRELMIRVPAVSCTCNRLLDLLAIKEARNTPTLCGNCGKTGSDCSYCFECGKMFCSVCLQSHNALSSSSHAEHKVKALASFEQQDYED